MRKFILTLAIAAAVILPAANASALVYTIYPPDRDIYDLDHYKAYKWGIDWSVPAGQTIVGAKLTYVDIYNWTAEDNDQLYTQLLNTSYVGLRTYTDNQGGGNYFAGQGTHVGTWTDPDDDASVSTLVYDFGTIPGLLDTFKSYAADGHFGFGIDADCHYFNRKVMFQVTTSSTPVPEPATMGLFGIGLAGMGYLKRRKKSS